MAHGDLTGNTKAQQLAEKKAKDEAEAKAAAEALAKAAAEKTDEVVDLKPTESDAPEAKEDGDVVVTDVDETEKIVQFKVNATLEQVTIGHGNNYDFEQGRTYKAPEHVYKHLEEKGLIWH